MQPDLIYGIHVIRRFLKSNPEQLLELFVMDTREDKRVQEIVELAKNQGIAIQQAQKKQLDTWFGDANHQGVAARIRLKDTLSEHDLQTLFETSKEKALFLVLDGVQDPHNLGAALRTADACGATAVIIPKDRSASLPLRFEKWPVVQQKRCLLLWSPI